MSHDISPRTARPQDNTRWTAEKAGAFLKLLAIDGKVARAARMVGMSRQAAYDLRVRAPEFAKLFEIARESGRQRRQAKRRTAQRVHPLLAEGRNVESHGGAVR